MEKLNSNELQALKLWQKRMVTVFSVIIAGLIGITGVDLVVGLSRTAAWISFLVLIGLVVLGGLIQFGQRCPRCGYCLGFQSRLVVPDNCKKCGIGLK